MRIARSMIFSQSLKGMNGAMGDIMRLNEQSASQKRINRPSDDPSGAARILDLQTYMNSLSQYDENITSAKGWLDTANEQLGTISQTITRMQELANQGATGTVTEKQRDLIATELRELQVQLIGLTNGDYAGNSLFAGAAIDRPAYEVGLGATVKGSPQSIVQSIKGDAAKSIAVKIPKNTGVIGTDEIDFTYSTDGGKTWKDGNIPAGSSVAQIDGVEVSFDTGKKFDVDTSMVIRPAAIYTGSVDGEAETKFWGTDSTVVPSVAGEFKTPVAIRIDNNVTLPLAVGASIEYSYSTDSGATWIPATTSDDKFLNIPGGQLNVGMAGTIASGEQFVVNPVDSAIRVEISKNNSVQVNSVGSNFFGGIYVDKGTGATAPIEGLDLDKNIFEIVGNLIGSLEMDDQEGVQKCLGDLKKANEHITTETGVLGGRQNRLRFEEDAHGKSKLSTAARISEIQDVDVAKISSDSARAKYIYESVLSTSAKVMNLGLLKYLK